ncbi:MAG: NAD/FAD-dependent oxidoreductase [Candidatus Melainabacteria bacterium HGW-Melainabacteria-1]|nr:MAG: NAD/FAD-dependent oxidoreductase [Candidatus Melainabacteria bacterium HGW-Melainabacteria-1]
MSHSCLVIGAGIAGIIAARRLLKLDWQVTVLEKSKGLGGRMATRRIGEAVFDHGAQFFTMHSMFFRVLVEHMQDEGVVGEWSRGFLNGDRILSLDGYLRLYGRAGMSAVAKYLAEPLDVRMQEDVLAIEAIGPKWRVRCKSGSEFEADSLILTAPLPQALTLVQQIPAFDPELEKRLKELKYEPCITVMATLDGPSGIPDPGAIASADPMSPIAWMADNRIKGISPVDCVTIHGTGHFSRQHWKLDREAAGDMLWQAAQPLLAADRVEMQCHGWRFARPVTVLPENYLMVQQTPPLLLAGDAFGDMFHPVEGAALSGLEAAKHLSKLLHSP